MNAGITAKSFRESKKAEMEMIKNWIDNNYETIWKLSEDARIISPNEPFRVDTFFGSVSFAPSATV